LIAALLLIPGILALLPAREVAAKQAQERKAVSVGVGPAPYGLIAFIGLVAFLRFTGRGAVMTFFNVYMDTSLNVPTELIGTLAAAGQLLSVPAALAAPVVIAHWGQARTVFLGSLGIAVFVLPLALIPHWTAAGLGLMGVVALSTMTTVPLRVYSQEMVSPVWRSAMSGALMMGAGLSISVIALSGGYAIAAVGYRSLFLASAGLTVAGALLFWTYSRVLSGKRASRSVPDSAD
jgi:predicted MFS family arabinose efflux permease